MLNVQKHLSLLGMKAKDRVTGFNGIVSSICFDLYGCIQAAITPGVDKDGKPQDGHWFDVSRLEIATKKPVMAPPNYDFGPQAEGLQGAAEKPAYWKM